MGDEVKNMDEKQLLRDPGTEPTIEIIADVLGATYKTYAKFTKDLESYGITLMDWRYYNDGKAWLSKGEYKWTTPRGANKVKPIFWLSMWEDPNLNRGFFKTTFFFSADLKAELQALPISREAKELIEKAKPMGKTMRFIPVVIDIKTDRQLSDVYELAQFRKEKVK